MAERLSGPCAGLRVVEVTTMVAGPMAGQMLADLGAEVIKIEPLSGDPLRGGRPAHHGMAARFMAFNRHKKSIFLDLKSAKGQGLARRLALTADVFLENARRGVMERLNLGYQSLREDNPGVVYASISGFGESGPYAHLPAFDQVLQAMTGVTRIQGGEGAPMPLRSMFVDKYTAAATASAVTAALLYRERNGGAGQRVSVSLLDAFSSFLLIDATNCLFKESDEFVPQLASAVPIRTKDGFLMGHVQTKEQFANLCRAIGREELIEDPRFTDNWQRVLNFEQMWREIEKATKEVSTADLMVILRDKAVPLGPINTIEDFLADPQAAHNDAFVEHEDEEFGRMMFMNYPARFEKSPADVRGRAPKPGEHSDVILRKLGLSDLETIELRNEGIVA